MRPTEPPEAHPRRPGPSRESGNNAPAVRRGRAGSARERPRRRRPGPGRGSPQSSRDPSFHLVAWITPPEGATPPTPRIHRQIANSAGVSTGETDPYASEAHVTSLDRRDNVNREEAAIPGEVRRWRAFALLAVAFFMTVVDLTIVNVALPTIGRKLHFSESNLQWVVTAYSLTFGGFLLLGGRAADLLGRRRIMMIGLGLFTAASLGAGLANSDGFLIAMRGLQGLGAAVVLPAALSIVMKMFSEGAERNKALGLWGGIGAAGATIGLITGGLLTRYAGWQYIFFLNVPIGAAALLLTPRLVPESRLAGARRRFDPLGAVAAGLRDLEG